ncbi:MAG: ADP-ribosylglycohydrolase family protein, partial [Bacteroidota bacterium]
ALVRDARRQSLPTHGHPRAGLCCALYCLWARRILEDASDPWASAVETLRRVTEATDEPEIDLILGYDGLLGTGYVVSTLHAAHAATEAGGFASVVRSAIAMGDDTDTTACVAGGITGLRDGRRSIPARWMEALRGKEIAQPLVDTLIARRST